MEMIMRLSAYERAGLIDHLLSSGFQGAFRHVAARLLRGWGPIAGSRLHFESDEVHLLRLLRRPDAPCATDCLGLVPLTGL